MKTLILIRHGEAEYSCQNSDFDRELSSNGKTQIVKAADILVSLNIRPQIIIASPASRTEETTIILCNKLSFNLKDVEYESNFYYKGYDAYIDKIIGTNDSVDSLLIVGHNPAISELASSFSRSSIFEMTTGAIVVFSFDILSWSSIYSCEKMEIFSSMEN
jgi:phosphohistidine phosphatase